MGSSLSVKLQSLGKDTTFNSIGNGSHWLTIDSGKAAGGHGGSQSPMELLLDSLGGCMGMDVINILRKKRTPFSRLDIKIDGTRREEFPKSFTAIHMTFTIISDQIEKAKNDLKRSADLSFDKYCSAVHMLRKAADITYSIEAVNESENS